MSEDELASRLRLLEVENAILRQQVLQLIDKVDNLNGGISRGLWILGGGFIMAFGTWIMNGGFLK
tara:strand:- start:318 stop:512 length:195 start_codon:yes stop_codon:yes gene_type:complete